VESARANGGPAAEQLGLDRDDDGTHTLRRTKSTLTDGRKKHLAASNLPLVVFRCERGNCD